MVLSVSTSSSAISCTAISYFRPTRTLVSTPLLTILTAGDSPAIASGRLAARCSPRPEWSHTLELPLLPFQPEEVLIPSESKTLHLYEARYLALLEESLFKRQKLFVHFVLEPLVTGELSQESFAARYGCLVFIENVERLEIGALVSVRGLGRVSIMDLSEMEPYLRGLVIPMQDDVLEHERDVDSKVMELVESLQNLHGLQMKLKVSKDEVLQTRTNDSLIWAEKHAPVDCDPHFLPRLHERMSFVPLQPVSGCSYSELESLQRAKLRAMEMRDTFERLILGIKIVKENMSMVAAKLAIQSLDMKSN